MIKSQRFFDIVNFAFDRILTPCRILFYPVWFCAVLWALLSRVFRTMFNEVIKSKLGSCGAGVRLNGAIRFTAPGRVRIGKNVHINDNAFFRSEGGLTIGDNVHIARNLTVYTRNHNYKGEYLPYDWRNYPRPVSIGKNVWIGINVSIAPGVTIGEGSIIGIGVVVTRDIEPFSIVVAGEPVVIRERDREHYRRLEEAGKFGGMSGYPNKWVE